MGNRYLCWRHELQAACRKMAALRNKTIMIRIIVMIRKGLKYIVLLVAVVWLGGTGYIEYNVDNSKGFPNPATCRAPFRVYAATWPIWGRIPDSVGMWIIDQSFKMCD
jgi:hypothetical protein